MVGCLEGGCEDGVADDFDGDWCIGLFVVGGSQVGHADVCLGGAEFGEHGADGEGFALGVVGV